jgi:hypothetical protein
MTLLALLIFIYFTKIPKPAYWRWWGWRHYHLQRPGISSEQTLTSSVGSYSPVRDLSPPELKLKPFWYNFWNYFLHPDTGSENVQKNFSCNWQSNEKFSSFSGVFSHKQQFTMPHHWSKLQACILYEEDVIVFFTPVRFIRLDCTQLVYSTVDRGQWAVDSELWTVGWGQWVLNSWQCKWTLDSGQWAVGQEIDSREWAVNNG